VVSFASDDSKWITGETLYIAGGIGEACDDVRTSV
jgi:hypothetical protein